MNKIIIGKKIGMTRVFDSKGLPVPVTVIEAGPCPVVQVKTVEKDGYEALQLGFGRAKKLNKPEQGHKKEATVSKLREFRIPVEGYNIGDEIKVDVFEAGDTVRVVGWSKGRGFAGVVKRHGFAGGPAAHGHPMSRRAGSIGGGFPQRVLKGLRMAGRMGNDRVLMPSAKVVGVETAAGLLLVKGSVPGARNGLVLVTGKVAAKTAKEQE